MIKEFTTKYGITYIGKYYISDDIEDIKYDIYTDVMMVSMKPVRVDEKNYNMVPALDIVNIFSESDKFRFKHSDIIYEGNVLHKNFINQYNDTINMYNEAKMKHGSNNEPVLTDVSVQKSK